MNQDGRRPKCQVLFREMLEKVWKFYRILKYSNKINPNNQAIDRLGCLKLSDWLQNKNVSTK